MGVEIIPAKKSKIKPRVCAYVRVSSTFSNQLGSLENQIQYFESMYRENADVNFVGIYQDKGISGSKSHRPGFQAMVADCLAGKIDRIHTKSISRFARNTELLLETSRELKTKGIDIYFEEQGIHTLSSEGEVMLSVLASLAEDELESMSSNLRWAYKRKFQKGKLVINAKRFLGYDLNQDGELVINPAEATIVKRIFRNYLCGMGAHRIAKNFNKEGIPTVTNSKWYDTTILNILKNEKYKGSVLLQKYYRIGVNGKKILNHGHEDQYLIEENHEAIIPVDEWDAVQELLRSRKKSNGVNKKYPFTGMLKCMYCGSTLKRQIYYKGKITWCCSKYIREGKAVCQGMRVPETEMSSWQITQQVTVIERIKDGKKYYTYSGQEIGRHSGTKDKTESQGRSLLSSVHRPRRTAIKL